MAQVIYSRHYNMGLLGLERLHPFDSRKYGRAWRLLKRRLGRALRGKHIAPRRAASREELLLVHSPAYLERLRSAAYVADALELPPLRKLPGWLLDRAILRPMRWATRGTILAAEAALEHGLAINISGGYHHAKPDSGEGFCIYADAAIAIAAVRNSGQLAAKERVVCIDLDAHQGNGVAHAVVNDDRVFLFDMFNEQIYPLIDLAARERVDCAIKLRNGCDDARYMALLREQLPGFLDSVGTSQRVGLAIYNAGTDIFAGDPLGKLSVSAAGILERDLFVVSELRRRNIPTVMLPSGGYTRESHRLIAESAIRLLQESP